MGFLRSYYDVDQWPQQLQQQMVSPKEAAVARGKGLGVPARDALAESSCACGNGSAGDLMATSSSSKSSSGSAGMEAEIIVMQSGQGEGRQLAAARPGMCENSLSGSPGEALESGCSGNSSSSSSRSSSRGTVTIRGCSSTGGSGSSSTRGDLAAAGARTSPAGLSSDRSLQSNTASAGGAAGTPLEMSSVTGTAQEVSQKQGLDSACWEAVTSQGPAAHLEGTVPSGRSEGGPRLEAEVSEEEGGALLVSKLLPGEGGSSEELEELRRRLLQILDVELTPAGG